ncbi:hypothetical protein [Fodinibius salsisoli]|uniref:Uncharacterized protein n=1 Tax=Fodinibius salsisoli TaxID=2820877 RepID=A0ABT3PNB9_9BACT|nr:hypothetical protein [Fodinibius salsisoli]MCW9706749.1 hypothetical protein [Fodinibius salsisoli]
MQLSQSKLILLISSIVLLFVLQEVITYRYISEPYPALKMPSFSGNRMNDAGFYEITNVEIKVLFNNQDTTLYSPQTFFSNTPITHHGYLLKSFLPHDTTTDSRSHEQFKFLKPIIPGFFASRYRSRYDIQNNPETVQWLRKQITDLIPGKKPEKVFFLWYKNQYDPEDLSQSKRTLTGTTTIQL